MNGSHLLSLQDLGLPANEAKVYVSLLETGLTTAGDLIKKSGLHRAIVYESLDRLVERKLATKLTRQGVFHFQPNDPERILDEARRREHLAERVVPELRGLLQSVPSEINVYEGIDAYRRFWLGAAERLPEGSTDYVAGSIGAKWQEYMGPDLDRYIRTRIERRIAWKMVVYDRDEVELELLRAHPQLHEYRIIARDLPKKGNFNILGDESVVLHAAGGPLVIEVKSADMVAVFRGLFDILWDVGAALE